MARKNKNKKPEYVVICREFNRAAARIDITVIDKGVTDHLLNSLIKLHERDPHKRYFLTLKKDYQVYGALYNLFIERMSYVIFNRYNDGLVHFIRFNHTHAGFSEISFAHSLLPPSFKRFRL